MIRKSFPTLVTKVINEEEGLVEAIVNTTGIVDLQKDVMEPGCWDELCKAMSRGEVPYPSILWGHDWAIPVGKVRHAEEMYPGDARLKGLNVKSAGALRIIGQYNQETQRGREAFSDVKKDIVPQWSVGFMPADDGHKYDAKGIHRISKVAIWPEVSNVLVGASPGTYTAVAKSAEEILANTDLSRVEKGLAIEQAYLKAMEIPVLEGAEAIHNEPLQQASTAIKTLIQQELNEEYAEPDCVMQLAQIWMSLIQWAQGEATEYTDLAADKPTEKSDEPQQQAETTAEADLTPEQEERLIELIVARYKTPPQHSDPEDSGALTLTNWAKQNTRPI